ncbi:MAG: EH signature domain-containing protein [Ancalomicrobiaceae bacterium]|nr:EH signature domain-containing protein [Ancalomicrobiaceae bacterium]
MAGQDVRPGLRAAARALAGPWRFGEGRPQATAAEAAGARVDVVGPGLMRPSPKDYDAIARHIVATVKSGGELSRADLVDAAFCVWTTKPAIAEDQPVLAVYLRAVLRMARLRPFRALASSYILGFRRDRPELAVISRCLATAAATAGPPWSMLDNVYGLFDPAAAIRRLSERAWARGVRPARLLAELRLGRLPRDAGLMVAVHAAGLERCRAADNRDPLDRLEKVALWALDDQAKLVSPVLAPLAIDALLAPFRRETPDRAIRDPFCQFILTHFGDPRLMPGSWPGSALNDAIARRWLSEQSLRMFFEVVARLAQPDHWGERRAFWEAVYRASLVDEAWPVFETQGADMARQIFGAYASFARFQTGSVPDAADPGPGQAVLMLQIGSLRVVDWSHGGACVIWDSDAEEGAPALARATYEAATFRKPVRGLDTIESHAAQGVFWHSAGADTQWQDRIATYLFDKRGIRLSSLAYRG